MYVQQRMSAELMAEQPVSDNTTSLEVINGLLKNPKQIAPKYFYDQKGSELFDAITRLDEYYITRVERAILVANRKAISAEIGSGCALIEPGAGSCEKVQWLMPELNPAVYVPMDISAEHLYKSAACLDEAYPELAVTPVVCDHSNGLDLAVKLPAHLPVFFYPGSSIGNFEPAVAIKFLLSLRAQMTGGGGLLIGVDTKKDPQVLHAAYNDRDGVTARFNLNVLDHLNRLLDGDLSTENFTHVAHYNRELGRVEMHLRCKRDHRATLCGKTVQFLEGEMVHTENSYKYHPEEFIELAARAGLHHRRLWQDDRGYFAVMYFSPDSSA
jgi:dimethylhistidine N-methyltransferase